MPVVYHTFGSLNAAADVVYIIDSDTQLTGGNNLIQVPESATNSSIIVAGEVTSDFDTIVLRATASSLVVEETGRVVALSNAAVWLNADNATLTNAGSLLSIANPGWTVYVQGAGNIIINTGEIRSLDASNPPGQSSGNAIRGDTFDSSTPTVIGGVRPMRTSLSLPKPARFQAAQS